MNMKLFKTKLRAPEIEFEKKKQRCARLVFERKFGVNKDVIILSCKVKVTKRIKKDYTILPAPEVPG